MNKLFTSIALCFAAGLFFVQSGHAQCYQLGTTIGQLSPILKNPIGFCPAPAQTGTVCDCPAGYVAVGYEGIEGNVYGPMVLSQFKLRCKQLNPDGTLGATVMVTCSNGTSTDGTPDGPVDAAPGQALVGAEVRIGCAMDAVYGYSKLLSEVYTGQPNAMSNVMVNIGGTGGSPQTAMFAPDGNVIVGMQTYVEPGPNPPGSAGITAGVAWRYAPLLNVPCVTACSIASISVSNISACNNNGTPSNPNDDTFTANVTVAYSDAPATGTLNLSGDATASIAVGSIGTTSYTFTGVTMSADGTPIALTATFSANPACTLTNNNAGTAPVSCSMASTICTVNSVTAGNLSFCNDNGTPNNSTDDTFTADITVTFSNPPASGTLNLTGSATASVPVGSLGAGSYTFTGLTMLANGQPIQLTASFSATSCTLTNAIAEVAPPSCSLGGATIPTMSEWGLILFALIIFSMALVFGMKQQQILAMGNNGRTMAAPSSMLPFDKVLYFKVLPFVYLTISVVFAIMMAFGYELTKADIPGSLLAGGLIAYLVQFVMKSKNSQ
ncbi:MAG: hypothetical protein H6574_15020 [Lewinellaceae bacterium]|nr:hypothetical protein [Saprospiraceae bacterium]MCB9332391.1 hypothetical protein [Lewinellaceae bacterium]